MFDSKHLFKQKGLLKAEFITRFLQTLCFFKKKVEGIRSVFILKFWGALIEIMYFGDQDQSIVFMQSFERNITN